MNKRQLAAKETKRKLIATALQLFKDSGFYQINVEDITRAAGVSKGTFYTYFKRKEDIVLEISRTPFAEISEELENMKDVGIVEKLSHYFRRFMECVEFCGIHICRQWTRDMLDPDNVPDNKDSQKWAYDVGMLQDILKKAVDNKELSESTPVELLTHLIISELYGMMTCWCMSDGQFEPLEWTERFSEVQIKTILEAYITNK